MKKIALMVAMLVSVVLAPVTSLSAVSNDELKIGLTQEFENLNPIIATMSATNFIYSAVGRAMVYLDANGKWKPQLAKTIPTLENKLAKLSKDKKTLTATWEILEHAKWGDGTPITCADFKFSRDVADNPNVSVGEKETYTMAKIIEWDPKTPKKCQITYDKPRWDYYQMGRLYPVPSHLEKEVYDKFGNQKEGYEKNSNYSKNPSLPGLYSGPYKVADVKLGSHVTLVPNEQFYGKKPKIKKVILKIIPNTATLEANLRSGTIDKVSSLGFSFDQALVFEKKVKSEHLPYDVVFKPSLVYEHIDLNLDNPMLQDVRVRKALVHAINRQELVNALFEGRQKVALHSVAPIDAWYTADPKKIVLYPYSKKDAAKLLDDAGWKLDAKDGYRYKDGKKLSFLFMTTAGNKTRETVQTFLQAQWKAVGVEVNIKNEPARVFFGETTKKRKYGGMAMYAWISSPEQTPKSTFHSESIPSEKNGWSGQNQPGWSNKKVDDLINKLEVEFDQKKRIKIAHEIMKYYTDEVPVIPLYYRADTAVSPTALKGFNLPGHMYSETNEIESWEVK